ncbi:hypothetical protein D3H65_01335 [Paraflavitalea soli]|uniref:Uncharacterized protein n=1 Tax=Paraflavitalea soli TaxID=2315862 RepID=A0A3B7MGH7_9BACT|nr:hypothetical protein [Paraflavitalea soli]AXY72697.1 hypothetical protein D3H65_01335 [Paraflavitalea soli]
MPKLLAALWGERQQGNEALGNEGKTLLTDLVGADYCNPIFNESVSVQGVAVCWHGLACRNNFVWRLFDVFGRKG